MSQYLFKLLLGPFFFFVPLVHTVAAAHDVIVQCGSSGPKFNGHLEATLDLATWELKDCTRDRNSPRLLIGKYLIPDFVLSFNGLTYVPAQESVDIWIFSPDSDQCVIEGTESWDPIRFREVDSGYEIKLSERGNANSPSRLVDGRLPSRLRWPDGGEGRLCFMSIE